ncbi:MAG: response regulator [Thermodesulfobacteriota bacterium]
MNEQEKIEAYLSTVRHDLRSQLMIVREGTSIILDNVVGSNCDNCFALLKPVFESTNELNKLIGEFLSTPQFVKMLSPLLSGKEEVTVLKSELLKNKGEIEKIRERILGKEEELRSVKRELLRKEEELKSLRKEPPGTEDGLKNIRGELLGHELEILTYELMGMISHIIRTPLAVVKESLSLVLDGIPGELNEKQKELLLTGKKNLDNLIHSVEELSQESWDEIVCAAREHFSAEAIARKDKPAKKKRILIVEDQAVISNMLKMRLEANNYEAITAGDGEEGLEKACKEKPSLIILDVMLPKMNGYKVCQILKADPKYSAIPIILSSGRTPQEVRKVSKEVGADAFVSKPFEAEELLSKMKELLEKPKR